MVHWLGTVAGWMVLLALLAVLVVSIAVPRSVGATPYTVLSSSMEPTYRPGTLLVVRPVEAEQLGIGDVITYQLRSGDPTVVTHRITAVTYGAGGMRFRTQGDHNNSPDPDPVRHVQVRGEVWYGVPYVGFAAVWIGGSERLVAIGVVAGSLVVYAVSMFVSAQRDHRRRMAQRREVRS